MGEKNGRRLRDGGQVPPNGGTFGRLIRDEAGSAHMATVFFATAVLALAAFGALHLAGVLQVPQLIFLILLLAVAFTGWDALRERRKPKDTDGNDGKRAGD
jgi:membrane protein implicated in regulation of membrane protease activity